MQVLLGSDEERLPEMLSRLGFANEVSAVTRPGASEQVENVTAILGASSMLSSENNTHAQPEDGTRPFFDVDNLGTSPRTATGGGGNTPMGGGPTSFFDNLGATNAATPTAASGRGGASANIGQALSIGDSGALEGEAEGETDLQRHLFVGNHSAAVTTCLSHDRLADALVVAHVSNDPALWRSTLSRYMELCPQPYLRVVEVSFVQFWYCINALVLHACVWHLGSPRFGAKCEQCVVPLIHQHPYTDECINTVATGCRHRCVKTTNH